MPDQAAMGQKAGSCSTERVECIGYFSQEEIRLAGLSCVFEEELVVCGRRLEPVVGSLQELLEDKGIRYLLLDLSGWQTKRQVLETIHRTRRDLRLIVIGPDDEELALGALRAGAKAYVDQLAPIELVRRALRAAVEGSVWASRALLSKMHDRMLAAAAARERPDEARLTARERQVLELILSAHSNREIGERLGIEERTVKAHVSRLMRKTGSGNRVGLSVCALGNALSVPAEFLEPGARSQREAKRP